MTNDAIRLAAIGDTLLDETKCSALWRNALDEFSLLCSGIGGITPDPCFDAWTDDIHLDSGVAISPQAAAHCVADYRRSVIFIRAVHAAILTAQKRFPGEPIRILYAGCGPFATLLLPLLGKFRPGDLDVCLLDVHQGSLNSVRQLLNHFSFNTHCVNLTREDASIYRHSSDLHLIISETMQKSLEQEPQLAVTANLAPQLCPGGLFIPEEIEVQLCLADSSHKTDPARQAEETVGAGTHPRRVRHSLATVLTLSANSAAGIPLDSNLAMPPTVVEIPALDNLDKLEAFFFTRIRVYGPYQLHDYEAEITLPQLCHEMSPLLAGSSYQVSYQTGIYPKFNVTREKDS